MNFPPIDDNNWEPTEEELDELEQKDHLKIVQDLLSKIQAFANTNFCTKQELVRFQKEIIEQHQFPSWVKNRIKPAWYTCCNHFQNQTLATYVHPRMGHRISLQVDKDLIDDASFKFDQSMLFTYAYPILITEFKHETKFYYLPFDEIIRQIDVKEGRLPANLNEQLTQPKKWLVERLLIYKESNVVAFRRAVPYDHKLYRPPYTIEQIMK